MPLDVGEHMVERREGLDAERGKAALVHQL